jgi:hypothetical protein
MPNVAGIAVIPGSGLAPRGPPPSREKSGIRTGRSNVRRLGYPPSGPDRNRLQLVFLHRLIDAKGRPITLESDICMIDLDADDLQARLEASGGFNPISALSRTIKTMVRSMRLEGMDDDDIRASLLGNLAGQAASQSAEGKGQLALLVRKVISEAFAEGPSDVDTVVQAAQATLPLLDLFGVTLAIPGEKYEPGQPT